ncbi:MAG: hypothetical protein ACLQNE_27830 [Thermoguttaceae bacterium]
MKRLLVLLAVLAPLSLFIAGCGDMGGSSGKNAPSADPKNMEETMKKGMQQMKMGGNPGVTPGGAAKQSGEAAKQSGEAAKP